MGPFFLNSASVPFYFWFVGWLILLPCHYIAFAMISLNCACWASFGPVMYFSSLSLCCPTFLLGQFSYHLRHSLAHFISLNILDLPYSFGHTRSILTFLWAFTKFFELSQPNYYILCLWGLLAFAPTPFYHFLSLGSSGPPLLVFYFLWFS